MLMDLALRRATEDDLKELVVMNKHLIEDEGSQNPMSTEQLADRMRAWFMSAEWHIDLIYSHGAVVGYALYQFQPDPYQEDRQNVYLRQYFVKREYRNQGVGLEGIRLLLTKRFQDVGTVTIDVLETNPAGMRFWRKAGFLSYSMTMKKTQ